MAEGHFAERYGPWAIIAGGSEGVGLAFADRLAAQGLKLLLIARKPGPLEEAADMLRKRHGAEVRTLRLDLTTAEACSKIIDAAKGREVGLLIYNAGADISFRYFLDRSLDESERMVMLNVMTPMRLVRSFAPSMAERKRGGIILVSSLAGLAGSPGVGIYSASKAFVDNFAEMLWYELGKQGIDVLAALLPLTRTPAMARLGLNFDGEIAAADPNDIAEEALAHIAKGPALHAGGSQANATALRTLPREEAVRMLAGIADAVQQ